MNRFLRLSIILSILNCVNYVSAQYVDFQSFSDKELKPDFDNKFPIIKYITADEMYWLFFQPIEDDSNNVKLVSWSLSNIFSDVKNLPDLRIPETVTDEENGETYNVTQISYNYYPPSYCKTNFEWCRTQHASTTCDPYCISYPDSVVRRVNTMILPSTISHIDDNSVLANSYVERFIVEGNNPNYISDDAGAILSKDRKTLVRFPACAALLNYEIDPRVETIHKYAFAGCHTPITFTSSIKEIPEGCFDFYTPGGIGLPMEIEEIKENAFQNTRLTHINIPSNCRKIDSDAFCNSHIEWLSLPKEIQKIDVWAFMPQYSIVTTDDRKYIQVFWMSAPVKGVTFTGNNKIRVNDYSFPKREQYEKLEIPSNVRHGIVEKLERIDPETLENISVFVNPNLLEEFRDKAQTWSDMMEVKEWSRRMESCIYTSQWVMGQMQCFTTSVPLCDDIKVKSVEWYSDDPSIVSINNEGLAVATGDGLTDIHAKITDSDGNVTVLSRTLDGTAGMAGISETYPDKQTSGTFSTKGVYNLHGIYIGETTDGLPAGLYIVNGKKVIVK